MSTTDWKALCIVMLIMFIYLFVFRKDFQYYPKENGMFKRIKSL